MQRATDIGNAGSSMVLQGSGKASARPAAIESVPRDRSSSDMDTAMEDAAAAKAADSAAGSRDSDSDSPRHGLVPGLQAEALRNILGTDTDKQVRAWFTQGVAAAPALQNVVVTRP